MEEKKEFYSTLAPFYDQIYQFIDYGSQARLFVSLYMRLARSSQRKVLDLCCGTGTHMMYLAEAGFSVTGFDVSKEMVAIAAKKVPYARLIEGDIKNIRIQEEFDFVLCWFNSILYSWPSSTLQNTLKRVYQLLCPGGIFIFDAVDKRIGIGAPTKEYVSSKDDVEIVFRPQWVYQGGDILDLVIGFKVRSKDLDLKSEWDDYHKMCAVTFDELRSMLDTCGFESWWFEKNYEAPREWNGEALRVLIVCRRPS